MSTATAQQQIETKAEAGFKGETVFDYIRHWAVTVPEGAALIDAPSRRVVSYGQLDVSVEKLALGLQSLGVRAGDKVVAVMPRGADLVVLILAVSRLGGLCLPYMSPRDIEQALAVARQALAPVLFIYSHAQVNLIGFAHPGERWIEIGDLMMAEGAGAISFTPVGSAGLYLNETSGSLDRPKIVLATHAEIIANTAACVRTLGIDGNDVHLCAFNSHAHEIFARALFTGGSAVLLQASVADNPAAFIDALVRYRVTCLMANATAYRTFVSLSHHPPSRFALRLAESGGLPTPEPLKQQVARAFNGARLIAVWGSTETGGVALAPSAGERAPAHSVGKALPGYMVEIVDEDGKPVKPGKSGELVITGAAVTTSYLSGGGHEQLSGRTFHTGDRARRDADGWIYIRGRMRNEFKVAGIVVSAEEIEAALAHSAHVMQAAVLSEFHPILGYMPVTLIVPSNPVESWNRVTEQGVINQIIEEAEKHLSHPFLELPRFIKWVTGDLPRTPAGKINRAALAKVYRERPPSPTKVRMNPVKELSLAVKMIRPKLIRQLILRRPLGLVRLVWTLMKGTKAK